MRAIFFCVLLVLPSGLLAQPHDIEVQALFTDTVVLLIGGERKMLKVGQSYEGVTVIAADSRQAVLDINGQRHEVGVSRRVRSNFQTAQKREIRIKRNNNLQYLTRAEINGRPMRVLVDTGANVMLLNTGHADLLRVDYSAGKPARVQTAGGTVDAWIVMLPSVDLQGIKVNQVQAAVVEGDQPPLILLGMSFLRHVEMQESDGIMTLSARW